MARDYSRAEVLDIIEREAQERNIPRDDFMRFAYIETGGTFDESVSRGPNGAKGLFQFVPGTADQYGIRGRELDPVANTDAAARLYLDNQRQLVRRHTQDGRVYLSGAQEPGGLDMYLAHQQGAAGYRSIQTAIATGEFSRDDTRSKILNNVSARDMRAVTGVSMEEFRSMSDKQMAETFVRYWDTKFDRVRIPEKGIELVVDGRTTQRPDTQQPTPQTRADSQAPSGIHLTAAHAMAVKYDAVGYRMGAKNVESGVVDCSGWVVALQNRTMEEINRQAGRTPPVFGREDLFKPGWDGSGTIVQKAAARSGALLEGRQVNADTLKEGMVIGLDTGPAPHDKWKGIDHVAMVVRDPQSGALMVTESKGGKSDRGVRMIPVDDFLSRYSGATLYASDPLAKARDLLQDRQQSVGAQALDDGKLGHGERGADVKGLQQSLTALGVRANDGTLLQGTGYYGDKTREVVANFQRANGLEPTGTADKATLEAIGKKLPDGRVTADARITDVRTDASEQRAQVSITDARHPGNALYEAIARQLPAGTRPEVVANVTLQAQENGITGVDKLQSVKPDPASKSDVWVIGQTPGDRVRVDLNAPTPDLQAMSEHIGRQAQEQQVQERQRQQVQASPSMIT
ncbi:peptidoglycan-binding protein [Lysobacter sp. M15]|uniref:peptidoglycan-binding protein n=1 Tax=Lysobacter sp. M15 TaxID=2916837 RepID=UPI001F59C1BF|nr:peptidoglycan-binding protein [Lysobacter sp. M15]